MSVFSIYVGRYDSPSATKNDLAKLNKLGLKGFVFSRNDHYALKVFASPNKASVDIISNKLKKLGYEVEVEENKINNR